MAKSTGLLNANTQIVANQHGVVTAFSIFTDGTNQANATLYDSASANTSDKILWPGKVVGASLYGGRNWPEGGFVEYSNGLYVAVSGANASYIVEYM